MKILWVVLLMAILLSGCSSKEIFEVVNDVAAVPASATTHDVFLCLPESASKQTIRQDVDVLYICDNYLLTVQKMDGGDLAGTVKRVTGFDKEDITLIQTKHDGFTRWHCAWSTMGEVMPQVCRAVILDDGTQHHVVTVMADHTLAADLAEEWSQVLGTATLISTG